MTKQELTKLVESAYERINPPEDANECDQYQFWDGEWCYPTWGNDSLDHLIDQIKDYKPFLSTPKGEGPCFPCGWV